MRPEKGYESRKCDLSGSGQETDSWRSNSRSRTVSAVDSQQPSAHFLEKPHPSGFGFCESRLPVAHYEPPRSRFSSSSTLDTSGGKAHAESRIPVRKQDKKPPKVFAPLLATGKRDPQELIARYSEKSLVVSASLPRPDEDNFYTSLDRKLSSGPSTMNREMSPVIVPRVPQGSNALHQPSFITLEDAKASGLDPLLQGSYKMSFNPSTQQWEGGEPVDLTGFESSTTGSEKHSLSSDDIVMQMEDPADESDWAACLIGNIGDALERFPEANMDSKKRLIDKVLRASAFNTRSEKLKLIPVSALRRESNSTASEEDTYKDLVQGANFNQATCRWEFTNEEALTGFSSEDSDSERSKRPAASLANSPMQTLIPMRKGDVSPCRSGEENWEEGLEGEVEVAWVMRTRREDSSSEHWTSDGGSAHNSCPEKPHRIAKQKKPAPRKKGPFLIRLEDVDVNALNKQLQAVNMDQMLDMEGFESITTQTSVCGAEGQPSQDVENWSADFDGELQVTPAPSSVRSTPGNVPSGYLKTSPQLHVCKSFSELHHRKPQMHTILLEDVPMVTHMISDKKVFWDPVRQLWMPTDPHRDILIPDNFEDSCPNLGNLSGLKSTPGKVYKRAASPFAGHLRNSIERDRLKKLGFHKPHFADTGLHTPRFGSRNRSWSPSRLRIAQSKKKGATGHFFFTEARLESASPRTLKRQAGDNLEMPLRENPPKISRASLQENAAQAKEIHTGAVSRPISAPVRARSRLVEKIALKEAAGKTFDLVWEQKQTYFQCEKEHRTSLFKFLGKETFERIDKEGVKRFSAYTSDVFQDFEAKQEPAHFETCFDRNDDVEDFKSHMLASNKTPKLTVNTDNECLVRHAQHAQKYAVPVLSTCNSPKTNTQKKITNRKSLQCSTRRNSTPKSGAFADRHLSPNKTQDLQLRKRLFRGSTNNLQMSLDTIPISDTSTKEQIQNRRITKLMSIRDMVLEHLHR